MDDPERSGGCRRVIAALLAGSILEPTGTVIGFWGAVGGVAAALVAFGACWTLPGRQLRMGRARYRRARPGGQLGNGAVWGIILTACALLMMTTIGSVHPAIRDGRQDDPGPAATNFGKMTPMGSLMGDVIYGIVLGAGYGNLPSG